MTRPRKDPAAVALGRKGGKARAKLPPEELSRIGKLGGRPRPQMRDCQLTLFRIAGLLMTSTQGRMSGARKQCSVHRAELGRLGCAPRTRSGRSSRPRAVENVHRP